MYSEKLLLKKVHSITKYLLTKWEMIYYGNMPIITKLVHEDQTLTAMKKYEST